MNSDTVDKVRASYRKHGGNLTLVAKELGISADVCRQAFPQTLAGREVEDPHPGFDKNGEPAVGRKSMRRHIISVRHCQANWPERDRAVITRSRRQYDAGTHVMTQGRDGQWIIQYAYKRRKPIAPFNYFYGHFG